MMCKLNDHFSQELDFFTSFAFSSLSDKVWNCFSERIYFSCFARVIVNIYENRWWCIYFNTSNLRGGIFVIILNFSYLFFLYFLCRQTKFSGCIMKSCNEENFFSQYFFYLIKNRKDRKDIILWDIVNDLEISLEITEGINSFLWKYTKSKAVTLNVLFMKHDFDRT